MTRSPRLATFALALGLLASLAAWLAMRPGAPDTAVPRISDVPVRTVDGPREIGPTLPDEPTDADRSARLEQVLHYRDDPTLRQHADDLRAAIGKTLLATPMSAQEIAAAARGVSDDRTWVTLDPFVLETRLPGDTIRLDVPGAGDVTGTIEHVTMENGFSRWEGTIADTDPPARFSISQSLSDRYTVGNFHAAGGGFTIEATNGVGWIRSHAQDAARLVHDTVDAPH